MPELTDPLRVRDVAFRITSAFEGGRYDGYQNYDAGIISYGLFQFTLASGSLSRVVEKYLAASTSDVAAGLRGYQGRILARDSSLRNDTQLRDLLKAAGAEQAMRNAQDAVATEKYWDVAQSFSIQPRGVRTPLGQALFFDLAIHYGPGHSVASRAEEKFGVPHKSRLGENGITEEQLLAEMVQIRKADHYAQAAATGFNGLKVRADFWVARVEAEDWLLEGDENGEVRIFSRVIRLVEEPGPVPVEQPLDEARLRRAARAVSAALAGSQGYDFFETGGEGIVTHGYPGFTLASGLLADVVSRYIDTTHSFTAGALAAFEDRFTARDATLKDEADLAAAFDTASVDPAMRTAQDAVEEEKIWQPVKQAAEQRGLKLALTWALLYDLAADQGATGLGFLLRRAELRLGLVAGEPLAARGIAESAFVEALAAENRAAQYRRADQTGDADLRFRGDFWIARQVAGDWGFVGGADGTVTVLGKKVQIKEL